METRPISVSRRGLIAGLAAVLAAPAIVRASSLMPIKPWVELEPLPDLMFKCREHFMRGPWGTIPVLLSPFSPLQHQDKLTFIGAGEHIWTGDCVELRDDGLVYRARPSGVITGIATSNSRATRNSREFRKIEAIPAGTVMEWRIWDTPDPSFKRDDELV